MSELDHATILLCVDKPIVCVRRPEKHNDKTLSDIVAMTSPRNSGTAVIISINITKFSPRMNRHDLILGMTAAPEGTKVSKLIDRLVGINKRSPGQLQVFHWRIPGVVGYLELTATAPC